MGSNAMTILLLYIFSRLMRSLAKHGFSSSYRTFFVRRTKNVRYEEENPWRSKTATSLYFVAWLRRTQHQQGQQRAARHDARYQDVFVRAMVEPADRRQPVEHRQAELREIIGI